MPRVGSGEGALPERFDTVIIGGGSAGCVLANRLSADPSHRVLLLEAGRKDSWWDVFIHMPAGFSTPLGNPLYDWRYRTAPEPHMGGRRLNHARGRVLGGSSSINGMVYARGNPLDYDRWSSFPGMDGWSYSQCLPYFRRAESQTWGDDGFHGDEGPLQLEAGPCTNPLFDAFFEAMDQAGYARSEDLNGYRQEGYGAFDRNVTEGRRMSAARAYLHPVWGDRPNLEIRTHAYVQALQFEGKRVSGVHYKRFGMRRTVQAGRVVCSAGAIGTPQLLQLSGVGPRALLERFGIPVVAHVPGVGENLQDHLEVYVQHECREPVSLVPALHWREWPRIGWQWLTERKGPAASNHFEAGAFVRTRPDEPWPNAQLHFLPLSVRYDGTRPSAAHGYQIHAGPNLSDARGHVRIQSADPRVHPLLQFNYLSTERDRREWVEVVEITRHILSQRAFAPFSMGELSPGPDVANPEQVLDWVRRDAETALHPSCSCKMGVDDLAVVHPDTFEVHGVAGLHVVDASIMPVIPNANLHCTTTMLAEKAADALMGRDPLPADARSWHRAPPQEPAHVRHATPRPVDGRSPPAHASGGG